jgi:uncharacterized membrane protein
MRKRNLSTVYAIYLHYPYPTLTSTLSPPLPYTNYYLTPTLIPSATLFKTLLTITINTLTLHIKRWKKRTICKQHLNRHARLSSDEIYLLYLPLLPYSCSYTNTDFTPLHKSPVTSLTSLLSYLFLSSSY